MTLVPYDPLRQMESLRKNIMDRFFEEMPFGSRVLEGMHANRIDVYEAEDEIVAVCEVPGLESKEDVHITVDRELLTISGSLKAPEAVKEEQYHRRERFFGKFSRTVSLPAPVATEGVSAAYKNGILEVHLPKAQNEKRQRIDVEFH